MGRPVVHGLILAAMVGSPAFADDVGNKVRADGGSEFLVNAGDAIRLTCRDLAAVANNSAAAPLSAPQVDLFTRCGEMVRTVLEIPNGYGFDTTSETFDAIRQFSGEETSSQGRFATDNTNRQFGAVGARLDAIRRGARGAGFALNGDASLFGGAASADGEGDLGFAWFASANIGSGDRDQTENESEYDFESLGGIIGVDYAFSSGLVVGVAFGYADYDVDYADDIVPTVNSVTGGGIESDGYTGSVFGSYASERYFINAIAGVGANDFDMDRRAFFILTTPPTTLPGGTINRKYTAETESDQVAGQLTAGVSLGESALNYDFYVGVDYLSVEVDGYTEDEVANTGGGTPGLALTFGDQDIDSVQSILGWAVRMSGNTGSGVLVPYATFEWRHEFENDSRVMDYRYAFAITTDAFADGVVAPSFNTPTDSPDEDYFEVAVGLSAQFANNFLAFAQFDTSLGLSDTTASRVTVGLRGSF